MQKLKASKLKKKKINKKAQIPLAQVFPYSNMLKYDETP